MNQPNFLIFLADDMGYGDLGCYGANDLQTPHHDRLAAEGARFTQWYGGGPVCSASRAALLTGRYAARTGVPGNVPPDPEQTGLRADVPTLPEILRPLGYQTYACGKWHLGNAPHSRPHHRGFDDWFGMVLGCVDYYSHIFYWGLSDGKMPPRHDLWHNDDELFRDGSHIIDLLADAAIAQLRRAKEDGRPFVLYVAPNTPHYPMQAPPEAMERFAHLPPARQLTAAMMWTHDALLGRLLDELERLGLADNTCVFASSDHGPSRENRNWPDGRKESFPGGSTGGLRGEKFSLFEGGIHVPAILRWPGVVPPGTVVDAVGTHMDIVPTFLQAAGDDPARHDLDGRDVLPLLNTATPTPERELFWSFRDQLATRRGNWKLTVKGRSNEGTLPEDAVFLADLGLDAGEKHNCAAEEPDLTTELTTATQQWRERMATAAENCA